MRILKDLRGEIEGRDVLVVEDIVDTGHTLKHVLEILRTRHPARLEVCALLDKPSRREVDVKANWIGFEIPDRSSSATASTTPSATATCRISARCGSWSVDGRRPNDLLRSCVNDYGDMIDEIDKFINPHKSSPRIRARDSVRR